MLRIVGPRLPFKLKIAVSGGPDSMAVLDFFNRGGRDVTAVHFDHGTEFGAEAKILVNKFCSDNNISILNGSKNREKKKNESPEEYWRNIRYDFFEQVLHGEDLLIMAHTLDDQVEQWLLSSLHGNPNLMPYSRGEKIIRPFITTRKQEFVNWCDRKDVPYIHDPGNFDSKYMRSLIRNDLMPHALRVNPGLHKVIRKKILSSFS